jgi:hypothetical protein
MSLRKTLICDMCAHEWSQKGTNISIPHGWVRLLMAGGHETEIEVHWCYACYEAAATMLRALRIEKKQG